MRFHTQTAGVSLTAQQPENNIVRVAIQALAAVLGGTQSLHTNSMDEAMALPSEQAVTVALRTQQIIAEESGVANTIDPLGGSYFVEALTDRMEAEANAYFRQIERLGGVVPAIEHGFFQREIADAAYVYQREIDDGQRTIVGVNDYVADEPVSIPILNMDPDGYDRQVARLRRVRAERDNSTVQQTLHRLADVARDQAINLMPPILECVEAYATLGEINDVFREVFGEYHEPAYFYAARGDDLPNELHAVRTRGLMSAGRLREQVRLVQLLRRVPAHCLSRRSSQNAMLQSGVRSSDGGAGHRSNRSSLRSGASSIRRHISAAAIPGCHAPQKVHHAMSKRKSPRAEHFHEKIAVTRVASSEIRTFWWSKSPCTRSRRSGQ